jgi:hypothetical protein
VELARRLPVRGPNPDVAQGLGGAGLALLALWRATGDAGLMRAAGRAHQLLRFRSRRSRHRDVPAVRFAGRGRGTISRSRDVRRTAQFQWCNGPAGIGTFLIRLRAATGDRRFVDAAVQCAPPAADSWAMSPGACCGLSGSGHFLRDLAAFTADDRFRNRAEDVAGVIHA